MSELLRLMVRVFRVGEHVHDLYRPAFQRDSSDE
jgi:hypothetical protein